MGEIGALPLEIKGHDVQRALTEEIEVIQQTLPDPHPATETTAHVLLVEETMPEIRANSAMPNASTARKRATS